MNRPYIGVKRIHKSTLPVLITSLVMILVACGLREEEGDASGFHIEEWRILGPLPVPADEDPHRFDAAEFVGLDEAALVRSGLVESIVNAPAGSIIAEAEDSFYRELEEESFQDFYHAFQMQASRDEVQPVAYAESTVQSEREQEVFLMLASASGPRVWLNGELLYEKPVSRSLYPYEEAILMKLKKGSNRLLFRIPRLRHHWGLTARIEHSASAAMAEALSAQASIQSFLWGRLALGPGESVGFSPRGVPEGTELELALADLAGVERARFGQVVGEDWRVPETLGPGIYRCDVLGQESAYFEWLCLGDLEGLARSALERARAYQLSGLSDPHFSVLLQRIEIMLEPGNRSFSSEGKGWQANRNLIRSLVALEETLRKKERKEEPFAHSAGLHLRGFESRIDGATQSYRLYVPSNYSAENEEGIPLIVMLPTSTTVSRPFIRSIYMANIAEAERLSYLAEQEGVALLWSGFRNRLGRQACEITHLEEVLQDVEKDYRVERDRITLLAGCSGGAMAVDAIAALPTRFAAAGLMNPLFGMKRAVPSISHFGPNPAFQEWQSAAGDLGAFWASGGPPLRIVHDGGEPGHGEIQASLSFQAAALAHGYPVELGRRAQPVSDHFGAWKELLGWLAEQEREEGEAELNARASAHLSDLTVFNALAEHFTVVCGTAGSPDEVREGRRLAQEFAASWRSVHYGNCRIVDDSELDVAELDQNLVLIGDQRTNTVSRLLGLSLFPAPDSLQIDDRVWKGEGLSAQVVLLHPDHPGRKVILISGGELSDVSLETPSLPAEGWFRYTVWRGTEAERQLLDASL